MDDVHYPYLHHMQSLTNEMERAMKAIAADDLAGISESVVQQETHASMLETLLAAQCPAMGAIDNDSRLETAKRNLLATNRQFAALLRHSGQTIAILSTLCESHTGNRKEACGLRSKQQTWSCEV